MDMSNQPVPATTSIRRSRVHNVDSDRLVRRHGHLQDLVCVNPHRLPNQNRLVMRAAELHAVEREMRVRGLSVPTPPHTGML